MCRVDAATRVIPVPPQFVDGGVSVLAPGRQRLILSFSEARISLLEVQRNRAHQAALTLNR